VQLSKALQAMAGALRSGERDLAAIETRAMRSLEERGWQPDYLVLRRRADLQAPASSEPLVALAATRLRTARLIDNLEIARPSGADEIEGCTCSSNAFSL
jgi:pantoate--beta-alanine ligase